MVDDSCPVFLEYAYIDTCKKRHDCSMYVDSESIARMIINSRSSDFQMIYAKIRKIAFIKEICLKYDDKGELENEFYINPNKK